MSCAVPQQELTVNLYPRDLCDPPAVRTIAHLGTREGAKVEEEEQVEEEGEEEEEKGREVEERK